MSQPRLFSYTVVYDYGSAPNPYWDVCTLTICKPVIRRVADENDWIVGLREKSVVYAMRVTSRKSLADYDKHCKTRLRGKIPSTSSADFRRRVGDCLYDFSGRGKTPRIRPGIHTAQNRPTDLSGINSLLSTDFYYFGRDAVALPSHLLAIIQKRGHRSNANASYFSLFVSWIRGFHQLHNKVASDPQLKQEVLKWGWGKCARVDKEEAEADERRVRASKC